MTRTPMSDTTEYDPDPLPSELRADVDMPLIPAPKIVTEVLMPRAWQVNAYGDLVPVTSGDDPFFLAQLWDNGAMRWRPVPNDEE